MKSSTVIPSQLLSADGTLVVGAAVLEQLFDQTPDIAFFLKDSAGRYVVVNHSLVERNGFTSKQQLLGRRARDVYPGDLGRIPSDQDDAVIHSGRPLIDHLELHWRTPNRSCWCLTTKLPLCGADGSVVGLVGISRDVRTPEPMDDIPPGMTRALQWLEAHFDEPLSPASLAQRSGLSPTRFARLVKRIFGITSTQLIAKTRLAAASRLLKETDASVAEVAVQCGFYDHSAFTRAFRSATGATPTQYRQS